MSSYEQTLHLFGRWLSDELKIYTVDKITENVIRKYVDDLMVRGKYTFSSPRDYIVEGTFQRLIDSYEKGENGSIGTAATRPFIIKQLISRGYLAEKKEGK